MLHFITFEPARRQAYYRDRSDRHAGLARTVILVSGAALAAASVMMSIRAGVSISPLSGLIAFLSAVLFGATFAHRSHAVLEIAPVVFALAAGAHIALDFGAGNPVLHGLMLSGAGLALALMAPTWRSTLAALAALLLADAALMPSSLTEALTFWLPLALCTAVLAAALESERRDAFAAKWELKRRASSDQITGVSNRAHIHLLAHNEFSRAHRYREPFSCIMLEIDGLADITAARGQQAADTVVQLFAGYCVVVMRHCDSFGRLSSSRFLALLPETPGSGALTLASRMCRELEQLDVTTGGEVIRFTVSAGVAERDPADTRATDALRRADQALEDAIESGRNTAVLAPPRIDTATAQNA